jgi:hypothetical protein
MLHRVLSFCCAVILLAGLVPGAPARAEEDGPITYRVEQGDTLYGIAKRFLKSDAAAREVQKLNKVRNPRRLPVNSQLDIPRNLLRYRPVDLTIAAFSGPVRIDGAAPQVGASLNEGQVITTGRNGFISFRSGFGARFSMPSNSIMRLDRARKYLLGDILDVDFAVLTGRGSAGSPKLKEQDRLRMRTPKATTAVRGTDFRVGYIEAGDISLTEVVEGSVSLALGEATGGVDAGFGVASTAAGLGAPEALLAAVEFVEPGKIQTDEALKFTIVPMDRAQAYRVQLARDAGFLDVLSETITSDLSIAFDGLEDGRYFIHARGISATALEGNSQAYSFRRKRLGVSGSAAPSPLGDGFLFKWAAAGEGPSTFAFQLWREDDAAHPLVDETGLSITSLVLTDLAPGSYKWRVAVMQADKEDGLIKVWGAPESLVVSE